MPATIARILTPAEATSIQTALNTVAHANLVVDGHFGELSKLALIRFKHDHGIVPEDDSPTLATTEALGIAPITTPAPTPAPKLTPNPFVQFIAGLALKAALNRLFPGKDFDMDTISATIKSAWTSKLNWTMAVGVIFNIFMLFGHPVPADVQTAVITAGNSAVLVVGWVIRTWFTTSITTASAKAAGLK